MFGVSVSRSTRPTYFSYNFEDDFVDPFEINESPLIDARLATFGNNLKASDEYRKQAESLARKVFEKLRTYSNLFTVVDTILGGSFGKRTDVLDPDLDLVVIVDNVFEPPYTLPLDEFEEILRLFEKELRIVHGSIQRKSQLSVQFKFENGMDVDLLPAMKIKSSEVHERLQYQPERFYEYGTALCRRQLAFMKCFEKDDFAMRVIRLAKFWLKSLNFGEKYLIGGSTIMELLSIASVELDLAMVHSNLEKRSISRCLIRVWNMITKLGTVKVVFEEVSKNEWRLIPKSEIFQYQWSDHSQKFVASAEILNRYCFIVEPANPFNDMLAGQNADVLKKLKQFAQVSKTRLDQLLINFGSHLEDFHVKDSVNICKLFEPQPLSLGTQFPNGIPDKVTVSCDFVAPLADDCTRNPTYRMEIRNQGLMKKEEVPILDVLRQNLLSVINCIIIGNPDLIQSSEVERQIKKFMKDSLATEVEVVDGYRNAHLHTETDATLTFPMSLQDMPYQLKCSFSWKKAKINANLGVENDATDNSDNSKECCCHCQ